MPRIDVDGIGIHYESAGSGEPVVCLIHGSGGTGAVWMRQMEGLADVCRVIAPDLPGHGASGGDSVGTIDDAARAVRGLLDALGVARAIVGGHSMGGAIAQAFALAYPDRLTGLLLVGTGARLRVAPAIIENLERDYAAGVRFVLGLALAKDNAPSLAEPLARQTVENRPPVMTSDFRACDVFDAMPRLHEIRTPTLVICGEEDRLTPPKYARHLAAQIAGARLVVVPGAGHFVQVERADETTDAMRAFVLDGAARR